MDQQHDDDGMKRQVGVNNVGLSGVAGIVHALGRT